jgi:hypothetical protein
MKSSCHFLFNHLGLSTFQNSTKFANSNSLVSSSYKQTLVIYSRGTDHIANTFFSCECVFTYPLLSTGRGADHIENTSSLIKLLCYLATSCSMVHREHSSLCCLFAGTCILTRCLAMDICFTIFLQK